MLGQVLGKYRLVSKLGEGGMGTVYLGEHELLGSHAAVKVLLPEHVGDPQVVRRFFNEARAASAIKHIGIVDIFDLGRLADGTSFIVMELLRGENLSQRLRRTHLTLTQVVSVVAQTASALAAAHAAQIVHRDLKPENLFLLDDPGAPAGVRVKLLDFGVAKLLADRDPSVHTRVGMVLGTPEYMSPEQVRGDGDVDHRADLYALGCMMYRLLVGRPPFTGDLPAVLHAHVCLPPPPMRTIDARLPRELDELVLSLLDKDPARRPASADDIVAALGELGGGLLAPAVATPLVPIARSRRPTSLTTLTGATGARARAEAPPPPPRRRRWPLALATLAIAACGAFGLWLGRRTRDDADGADGRDAQVRAARLAPPRLAPPAAPPPIDAATLAAAMPAPDAALAAPPPAPTHPTRGRPSCVSAPRRRSGRGAPRGRSPC